jgi:hypothetical protein
MIYMLAVLEYIVGDILQMAGRYVRNIRQNRIALSDLRIVFTADSVGDI